MTDVLKIAMNRREKLRDEIERLNDFIRTAEGLIRESSSDTDRVAPAKEAEESPMRAAARRLTEGDPRHADEEAAEPAEVPRPSIIRRGMAS